MPESSRQDGWQIGTFGYLVIAFAIFAVASAYLPGLNEFINGIIAHITGYFDAISRVIGDYGLILVALIGAVLAYFAIRRMMEHFGFIRHKMTV